MNAVAFDGMEVQVTAGALDALLAAMHAIRITLAPPAVEALEGGGAELGGVKGGADDKGATEDPGTDCCAGHNKRQRLDDG